MFIYIQGEIHVHFSMLFIITYNLHQTLEYDNRLFSYLIKGHINVKIYPAM